jgi:hypothetical protein
MLGPSSNQTRNQSRDGMRETVRPLKIESFLDELAGDGLDLGLRLLVIDSVATLLSAEAHALARSPRVETAIFFTHHAFLLALRDALDRVSSRAADPRVARVIAPDAPLGAYVKGQYLRALAVARALELVGFRALEELEEAGDHAAFARMVASAATFHFPDLRESIRRDLAALRLELGQPSITKGLRDAVEQLFVASASLENESGTDLRTEAC